MGRAIGGLDAAGEFANVWYHVFLIWNPVGQVADILFSQSATSPTMPTNYTKKRRIGSVLSDASGHLTPFTQLGDEFLWTTPVTILNAVTAPTSATLLAVGVPTGVKVQAYFTIYLAAINGYVSVWSPDQTGSGINVPSASIEVQSLGNGQSMQQLRIRTNTSGQVLYGGGGTTTNSVYVISKGWIDNRGK